MRAVFPTRTFGNNRGGRDVGGGEKLRSRAGEVFERRGEDGRDLDRSDSGVGKRNSSSSFSLPVSREASFDGTGVVSLDLPFSSAMDSSNEPILWEKSMTGGSIREDFLIGERRRR